VEIRTIPIARGWANSSDLEFFLDARLVFRKFAAMSDDKILSHLTANVPPGTSTVAWFCLRSQPKHEHIAAEHLRRMEETEVFNPRIRFTRSTRIGPAEVTESMFPNYLFARFDWQTSLNRVHYAPGVAGVVHFGSKWPTVPDRAIEEIRTLLGDSGVHVLSNDVAVGDQVTVSGTVFHGLQAIVRQVMPGKQRVMVLMDFLGRQTTVQVGMDSIVRHTLRR
jgi:transcriptional antiterminator RfaH